MRIAASLRISRLSLPAASAILLAGAVLFAASAAHADPWRHGGRHGDGPRHGHSMRADTHHRSHGHDYRRYDSSRINRFSLSIGSGYSSYHPYDYGSSHYYRPRYYYPSPPVIYPVPLAQPVYYPVAPAQPPATPERYCREYTRDVWVGGRKQQSYGSACLQPDGSWEMES